VIADIPITCEVCGRHASPWSLFWRRIWRRIASPRGDRFGFVLDAFALCSRAECAPYARFWSDTP